MKEKKSYSGFIIAGVIFVVLYIIFAVHPLGKEYQFNPEWKISISTPSTIPNYAEDSTYFKLGNSLGYFTEDGKLTLFSNFPSKAAISENFYCFYSSDSVNNVFYDNKGNKAGVLEPAGYPLFHKDRIYVFLPGGTSFAKCDFDGKTLWDVESVMPVTAFASTKNYTAAGYINGSIKLIENETGFTALNYAPGGSDYPVILGLDITEDGNYIASVSGHDKQRFTLAKREDNQSKIIFHTFLNTDIKSPTLVKFTKDGKRVFYDFQDGVGVYNLEKNKNSLLKAEKHIIDMAETENLVFLLGKNKKEYTVYMVQKTDKLEGVFSFTADTAFIKTKNNNLYIGKDSSISKISLNIK